MLGLQEISGVHLGLAHGHAFTFGRPFAKPGSQRSLLFVCEESAIQGLLVLFIELSVVLNRACPLERHAAKTWVHGTLQQLS